MTGDKFQELMNIMRRLRTDCSWDSVQTHDSIKANTLEEAYEVVEAIDEKIIMSLKQNLAIYFCILFSTRLLPKE